MLSMCTWKEAAAPVYIRQRFFAAHQSAVRAMLYLRTSLDHENFAICPQWQSRIKHDIALAEQNPADDTHSAHFTTKPFNSTPFRLCSVVSWINF